MKDILTIIFRLTVACLLAAVVMGATFVFTNKAKKDNAVKNEQRVMLSLLGYGKGNPAPASLALHEVYRYIVSEAGAQTMGYLLPAGEGGHGGGTLVVIDLEGKFVRQAQVSIAAEKLADAVARTAAVQTALGPGASPRYADQTVVVTRDGKRVAYLLPGKFPGFKTFISVMLALDQKFTILGLEIMEHEEDPGLGGEIVQKYFKNQFKGKTVETMKAIEVVKTPLPADYLKALEAEPGGGLGADEVAKIQAQYQDKDIYALTGATISSRSLTNGVKGIVQKFAYRLAILDRVVQEQKIGVPF